MNPRINVSLTLFDQSVGKNRRRKGNDKMNPQRENVCV